MFPYIPADWTLYYTAMGASSIEELKNMNDAHEPELKSEDAYIGPLNFRPQSDKKNDAGHKANLVDEVIRQGNAKGVKLADISEPENQVLEYHAYLRELVRFDNIGMPKEEIEEIARRANTYKSVASLVIEKGNSEIVDACEKIQSFNELEAIYIKIMRKYI
jgi:hypothetical protein